jgi:TetR/AcrR family transcriptional repressor of nem operon
MLREKVQEILDRKIRYFESAIRDAHSQGLIVAPDAKGKAKGLFACYQGTLAQARIQNNLEPVREFKHLARDILGLTQGVAAGRS